MKCSITKPVKSKMVEKFEIKLLSMFLHELIL